MQSNRTGAKFRIAHGPAMPRTYAHKTKHGAWSSESLANAIEAVKEGMTQNMAAKRFGIPISTLHRHYRGNLNAPAWTD